jgi:HAD superfamily phosphoserine phosphatase-like hydrolase
MNIYDFDGTIYEGDSCHDIVIFGLKHYPHLTLNSLIKAGVLRRKYKNGKISFKIVKENLLSFIFKIKNYKTFVNEFVNTHMCNIKPFYKEIQNENDIIVTASYELWINVFAKNLGVKYVIATKTDKNGNIIGDNCKGKEKVRRLLEEFKDKEFINAYSDSSVDIPILELAKNPYVVEGNKVLKYRKGYNFKNNK